jgi:hypothetical protein
VDPLTWSILVCAVSFSAGAATVHWWHRRERRLARQFIHAKCVTAAVDLHKHVPYEIWEAVAPHERD